MGISPIQLARADFTADVEFHQPPKFGGSARRRLLAYLTFVLSKHGKTARSNFYNFLNDEKKGCHVASLYGF